MTELYGLRKGRKFFVRTKYSHVEELDYIGRHPTEEDSVLLFVKKIDDLQEEEDKSKASSSSTTTYGSGSLFGSP